MLKKLFTIAVVLMAACTMAQAASHTTTFQRSDFTMKGQSKTYTDDVTWTNDGTWKNFDLYGAYFGWSSTKALQFGSTSNPCLNFSLTSSSFEGKVITKVTVMSSTGTEAVATCTVSVGGVSYGSHSLTMDPTSYEFSGNASGDIVVSWAQTTERALYVTSITVDYEEAATELTAPVVSVSKNDDVNFDPITVTMTADTGASIYYTLDGTAPTAESTLYTAPFQVAANATIKAIAVKGELSSPVSDAITLVFGRSVANIAEFLALANEPGFATTTYVCIKGDVAVTYHNRKNLFVKDATGYLLLSDTYSRYVNDDINNGDIIPGGFYGRLSATTPVKQMNYLNGVGTITPGDAVAPIDVEVSDINEDMVNKYVRVCGVKTTAPVARSFVIISGDNQVEAYNQFNVDMNGVDTEKGYDITGIVSYSFDPILYPVEFTESTYAGIKGISEQSADTPVFNLAGQRVNINAKGIKIANGKKFM